MGRLTVLALRIVFAVVLVGSLFVQVVMVPLLAADLDEVNPDHAYLRVALIAFPVLFILAIQVAAVSVWKLVTMVRSGTVFSDGAFRYVDIVIGSLAAASALTFGLGIVLAPGEAVAPGVVLLVGGAGVLVAGIALIVLVLRFLLVQAVARDEDARHLQAELDEVV